MFSTRLILLCALASLPTAATRPAPAITEQSVRRVATLHTARAVHTATPLLSGDILIVGGMTEGGGAAASAELVDPRDNSTRDVGSLVTARHGHSATLLPDGRVLVAGGYNGDYLASLEMYDPSSKRFRPAGSLAEPRSGHTATMLPDGRILFTGGVGTGWTFLRSAELYDPATARSESVGSMTVPRESHVAALLEDGRVLIVGGHAGRRENMVVYSSAEIFSPTTRQFTPAASMRTPRHKHDAVKLHDGRILVLGGADRTDRTYFATTEIYNPRTDRFDTGPTMANERYKIAGTTVVLPDGGVLVTSGARTAELFDATAQRVREVTGGLSAAFRFAAAAPLHDGDVLITGGYDDRSRITNGVWRFEHR